MHATPPVSARTTELSGLVERGFAGLVDSDDPDRDLTELLGRMGRFLAADRAYVIRVDRATDTTSMTHEWCADGVVPSMPAEQSVPITEAPRLQERLERLEVSEVRDVAALPASWSEERGYLQAQGIAGILEVPFTLDGRLSGVIGFDYVHRPPGWTDEDLPVLRAAAALTERLLSQAITDHALQDTMQRLRALTDEFGRSERRFRRLVDALPDSVIRVDLTGRVVFANAAALRYRDRLVELGVRPGRSMAPGWPQVGGEQGRRFEAAAVRALTTGQPQHLSVHIPDRVGDTDGLWSEVVIVPEGVGEPDTEVTLLAIFRDVTASRLQQAELERRATRDDLTGLANRAVFLDRLEWACARTRQNPDHRVAVLFIDLDDFKLVNDSHGHHVGDHLLQELAGRLERRLRPGDLLARFGGDELTVLLEPSDPAQARIVAGAVRACVSEPVDLGGTTQRVSASVGIAVSAGPTAADDLLSWADAAVYRAKAEGRDRAVVFDDALRLAVRERRELDRGLRGAVQRGEIEVFLQPEVELATGRVVGAEALARWRHPDRGLLSAAEFITVAEENGIVLDLGRHVLAEACRTVADWVGDGTVGEDFVVRVNLSPRQLSDPLLVPHLRSTLASTGLAARQLCLELTETAIMRDAVEAAEVLEAIRGAGVQLAVDDFGTGYSSLVLLKRLPIDVVKIDAAFVDGLPDDTEDVAIVAAVMGLADSLRLQVTAEGVERPEQAAHLRGLGCRSGQGYLWSPPVPTAEFAALLSERVADLRRPAAPGSEIGRPGW